MATKDHIEIPQQVYDSLYEMWTGGYFQGLYKEESLAIEAIFHCVECNSEPGGGHCNCKPQHYDDMKEYLEGVMKREPGIIHSIDMPRRT